MQKKSPKVWRIQKRIPKMCVECRCGKHRKNENTDKIKEYIKSKQKCVDCRKKSQNVSRMQKRYMIQA